MKIEMVCKNYNAGEKLKDLIEKKIAKLDKYFEDGATVTIDALIEKGIVKKTLDGVKILGNGEISKKLTVQANAFSDSAKSKIEAAGGKAEVI